MTGAACTSRPRRSSGSSPRATSGGDLLTIDETVAIMGTLDTIREQIGLRYPGE